MSKPTVALLGLGLMGRPMALNLAKAGFPLKVWNRTRARAEELAGAAHGVVVASTANEAANADVVLTIVSDPPALEEVL